MDYGPQENMSGAAEAMRDISHEVGLAHRAHRRLGTLIEPHWTIGERGYGYDLHARPDFLALAGRRGLREARLKILQHLTS